MQSKALRELREELHYWQMQARMEARWLRASREKCKALGLEMRRVLSLGKGSGNGRTARRKGG